jgi:hypothetical protein
MTLLSLSALMGRTWWASPARALFVREAPASAGLFQGSLFEAEDDGVAIFGSSRVQRGSR